MGWLSSVRSTWLLGAAAVTGVSVGLVLGVSGIWPSSGELPAVHLANQSFYRCPGSAPEGSLNRGDRVFVIGKAQAGDWLAIRHPQAQHRTSWVPARSLTLDTVVDLPVVECFEDAVLVVASTEATTTTTSVVDPTDTTTTTAAPTTTTTTRAVTTTTRAAATTTTQATTTTTQAATTTTTTTPDNTSPSVSVLAGHEPWIVRVQPGVCPDSTVIQVSAFDNIGVTSVTGTYSGLPGSPLNFTLQSGTPQSGTWRATFGPFYSVTGSSQDITITVVARDAAGNQSSPKQLGPITVWNECLI